MKDYNGIFLWIHGGAWISGNKESKDIYCKLISEQGYISATLDYTLLKSHFKKFNIFKNIDEITSCIKAIKNKLINLGFNEKIIFYLFFSIYIWRGTIILFFQNSKNF